MFDTLKKYQDRFLLSDKEIETYKSSSSYLLELFRRCDVLVDEGMIVYTHEMDMEPCQKPYCLANYQWGHYPESDPEWGYMMNRQGFLVDLSVAYFLTKDEKYLCCLKKLLFDFIESNLEELQYLEISWRPLDVGIRLMNWIKSMTYISGERFSEDEKTKIRQSIRQHIHYMQDHFIDKYLLSNWGVLAVSGMLSAIYFEKEHYQEEYSWAKSILQQQAALQFSKKGMHWEQSPLYHHQVVMSYAYLYQLCMYLELEDAEIWSAIIQQPIECSYFLANHQGTLLAINDSDAVNFDWVYSYYHLLGFKSECKDGVSARIYTGRQFREQREVQFPVLFVDRTAGWCVIKNKQNYFSFFCGLHGSSHGHASIGNLSFSTPTKNILVNLGRFTYEDIPMRQLLKSEVSYNTVLLSNREQSVTGSWQYQTLANPMQMGVEEFEEFYLVEGSWRVPTTNRCLLVTVQRKIIVFKNTSMIIMIDECHDQSGWQVNYLLDSDCTIESNKNMWTTGRINHKQFVPCSPGYHQQSEAMRVVIDAEDSYVMTVIAQEKIIMKCEDIFQVDSQRKLKGSLLEVRGAAFNVQCAYLSEDIISGNKLFNDQNGNLYYGQLNLRIGDRKYRIR